MGGQHHDMFETVAVPSKKCFQKVATLQRAGINSEGLFLNGDARFNAQKMREICEQHGIIVNLERNKKNRVNPNTEGYLFDGELYKERFALKKTNAWIDGFKALLVRYEINARYWLSLPYLAITFMLLQRKGVCDN